MNDQRDAYLLCRTITHTFNRPQFDRVPDITCERCGTRRMTRVDERGRIVHRQYLYPEGVKP